MSEKHKQDLQYLSARIVTLEQRLASLRALLLVYDGELTLNQVKQKIEIDIDNYEYTLKRDRINHDKPT